MLFKDELDSYFPCSEPFYYLDLDLQYNHAKIIIPLYERQRWYLWQMTTHRMFECLRSWVK